MHSCRLWVWFVIVCVCLCARLRWLCFDNRGYVLLCVCVCFSTLYVVSLNEWFTKWVSSMCFIFECVSNSPVLYLYEEIMKGTEIECVCDWFHLMLHAKGWRPHWGQQPHSNSASDGSRKSWHWNNHTCSYWIGTSRLQVSRSKMLYVWMWMRDVCACACYPFKVTASADGVCAFV